MSKSKRLEKMKRAARIKEIAAYGMAAGFLPASMLNRLKTEGAGNVRFADNGRPPALSTYRIRSRTRPAVEVSAPKRCPVEFGY